MINTIILDPGHGGILNGKYQTEGKQYHFEDGTSIYEGEVNRGIAFRLAEMLVSDGIPFYYACDLSHDTSLSNRVHYANSLVTNLKKKPSEFLYLSIHCNAGHGHGFEVYTSIGDTLADKIAETFIDEFEDSYKHLGITGRYDYLDGDKDKESNFFVLSRTKMPAILTENLFFDNPIEAEYLLDPTMRALIAGMHYDAIKKVIKGNI